MATRIFKIPFASQGDTETVPVPVQGDGKVSITQGFGYDYEREYEDPAAKDIKREVVNGILHDLSEAIGEMQQFGFAAWQPVGGGWPIGANVNHAGGVWQSLANANTEEPGSGALWKPILFDSVDQSTESVLGLVRIATTAEAQALIDDSKALTPKKLADSGAVFAGEVRVFAGAEANVPDGWLPCNGATISRTTYSRLFAVIGTTYGSGNGSTTFNIPDLRGDFVRGLDNGRGVDAGRALGSPQQDALQNIAGSLSRVVSHPTGLPFGGAFSATDAGAGTNISTGTQASWNIAFEASNVARTADETRPRNVAMNYIIKY